MTIISHTCAFSNTSKTAGKQPIHVHYDQKHHPFTDVFMFLEVCKCIIQSDALKDVQALSKQYKLTTVTCSSMT